MVSHFFLERWIFPSFLHTFYRIVQGVSRKSSISRIWKTKRTGILKIGIDKGLLVIPDFFILFLYYT